MAVGLLGLSGYEFGRIAWGSGHWLLKFSLKWAMAFGLFALLSATSLIGLALVLRDPDRAWQRTSPIQRWFARRAWLTWILAGVIALAPATLIYYTRFGSIFAGPWMRVLLSLACAGAIAFLLGSGRRERLWAGLLAGALAVGATTLLAQYLHDVVAYPFSLSWSEGNRLWDYSVMFGWHRYQYPAGAPIFAYIASGRQALWGLPFLYSGLTIWQERLWDAFLFTVPYAILGWLVLRNRSQSIPRAWWVGFGLWSMLFLAQGPIYTPLVLSAILVTIAVRTRLVWATIALIAVASYYAFASRWTWMFAPAMWAGMVVLTEQPLKSAGRWRLGRMVLFAGVAVTGLLAGFVLPNVLANTVLPGEGLAVSDIGAATSGQPLLWYRLLPNPTLGPGVLLALLVATGPAVGFAIWAAHAGRWKLERVQWTGLGLILGAFLVVGIVASAKIGGGSNLHNLDMFLIGVVFLGALSLEAAGRTLAGGAIPAAARWLITLAVLIPAMTAGLAGGPLKLPPADLTAQALKQIQIAATDASTRGEVLFMDQRQLLTFGQVRGIPLVPEYEKKYVMDLALGGDTNADYFRGFYQDLARGRFSLIVTERLGTQIQGSGHGFGEENDAWVTWVSKPVLCYYQPVATLEPFGIELLTPRAEPVTCSFPLPNG